MEQAHAAFVGSIPVNYDRYLGPVLFDPNAEALVRLLPTPPPRRVLELACGTGILTRALRDSFPDLSIVATDLNAPMLDYARSRPDAPRDVEWKVADMSALPFPDASFDGVLCQFGLMFVPDKPATLREIRRVLEPGGILLLSVWDSIERNPYARVANAMVDQLFPVDPPTFYRTPFGMHDTRQLRAMLAEAGFEGIRIDPVHIDSSSPSAADLAQGLVEGNPFLTAIQEHGTVPVATVRAEFERAIARELGESPVKVELNAFSVVARAPRA